MHIFLHALAESNHEITSVYSILFTGMGPMLALRQTIIHLLAVYSGSSYLSIFLSQICSASNILNSFECFVLSMDIECEPESSQ